MSEQSARLVDQLRARLRATIQRMTLAETAFGAVITTGTIAAVWLLFAALEAGLWMGTTLRAVLIGTVAAAAVGLVAYFLARPLLQLLGLWAPPPEEAVARRIGQHYPEVSDRLVNVLQLAEGRRSPAPDAFVDRAVQSLSEEIESIEFEQVEDFSRARAASRLASLPIAGLLIFLMAAPGTFLDASQRLLAPGTSFERPAPFQLQVMPGDTDLAPDHRTCHRQRASAGAYARDRSAGRRGRRTRDRPRRLGRRLPPHAPERAPADALPHRS